MSLNISESLSKELASLKSIPERDVAPVPVVGDKAPVTNQLNFSSSKPTLIVFLRHCGCPFAEKTFKLLTAFSNKHPSVRCVAVSHSSPEATDRWVIEVGGAWEVEVLVDPERHLYAEWGLGLSTTWHAMNPWSLYNAWRLGKDEGIWNRTTESGSRWQTSGAFAVDESGYVRWARVNQTADQIPDLKEALEALRRSSSSALP